MVFKRKNYSTTTEILDLMKADDEIMRSTAVFYFHRKDKVSGKIYFRKGVEPGLVYAAHVSNMPFHIGKRIKPLIDPEEYEEILRQVGGDDTDPAIARLAISKQLVASKVIDAFIREYLFSAASEIFSWEEAIGTWERGTETQDFASRHYIGLELLQKKAADRDAQYKALIAETKLSEEEIETLKVLRKGSLEDFSDIENRNLQSIIEFADGRHTVAGIRDETGLLKIPAFLGIHALWSAGRLQLLAGDIPVYPPNLQHEEEEPVSEDVSEPIEFSSEESMEETAEESELHEEEISEADDIQDDEPEYVDFTKSDQQDEVLEIDSNEADETIASLNEYSDNKGVEFQHWTAEPQEESEEAVYYNPLTTSDKEESHDDYSETYDITTLPAPLPVENVVEEFPEPAPLAPIVEETIEKEIPVTNTPSPVSGASVFDKLYARIDELQKEVTNADANIKQSELAVRAIDRELKEAEESIVRLKSERSQAVKNYHAVVARSKESKEKLEKIVASIDSLTA